jgi:RNA polymerase sigma factor (sigma-70 family)
MTQGKMGSVERQLDVLWTSGTLAGLSDAQLLCRFNDARDATAESAFSELVNRHGPMVRGVCRHILRHTHDADDAFQATFLVLVRKARSIQVRESLAPWLYSVAYRTAQRARASGSRYRQEGVEQLEAVGAPAEDAYQIDLRPLLHEELDRLPDKYRAPIVLCHLEGKTHEQAAQLLHWPIGTVSGRLSRGRELLKSRLERRGLAVPSALLSASSLNLVQCIPSSLVESTLSAATRFATAQSVSAPVLALTHGALRTMFLNKLKAASIAILLFGAVTGGVGLWTHWTPVAAGQPIQDEKNSPPLVAKKLIQIAWDSPRPTAENGAFAANPSSSKNVPNVALFGDPIPDGQQIFTITSSGVIALAYTGKTKVGTVAAYSPETGEWYSYELVNPVHGGISPMIGPDSALYQAGNDFYAFSALAGKWGLLRLPADQKAIAAITQKFIEVRQGNRLYVFSVKPGKWSKGVAISTRFPGAVKQGRPNPDPNLQTN